MAKTDNQTKTEETNTEMEEQLKKMEDQLKRAVADYHNLEKRVLEDAKDVAQYSRNELVKKILPVLDSLDKAVEGALQSEAESGWLKGVMMAIKQLRQVFAEEGLIEIPTEGRFDPNLHEAVDVRDGEEGAILEVTLRGYTLNGKVIRPAKVVVGKKNPEKISAETEKELETEEV